MTTKDVHVGNKNTTGLVILAGVDSWPRTQRRIVVSSAAAGYLVGAVGGAWLGLAVADEVLSSDLTLFGERLTGPLGAFFKWLFTAQLGALGTVLGGPVLGLAGGALGFWIGTAVNTVPDTPPPTPSGGDGAPAPTGQGPGNAGSDPEKPRDVAEKTSDTADDK